MKKQTVYTLVLLMLLTIITALFSSFFSDFKYAVFVIMGLFSIKFLAVTFEFMELKKAHVFWKVCIGVFLGVFMFMILIV